jgi:hypothetical protein
MYMLKRIIYLEPMEGHFPHSIGMCRVVSSVKASGHELDRITVLVNGFGIFTYTMSKMPFGAYNTT